MRGSPRDIEWAIDDDGLWLLQDRPMTALPPDVAWAAPARGAFSRAFRFGEWISEPVTPLFESWLLTRMEDRLHEIHHQWVGQVAPRPRHVLVNGWYFYSLNFMPVPGGSLGRSLPGILLRLARSPRRVAVMLPPTARLGVSLYEREWREELLPRYRSAISDGAARVETEAPERLPALIDELSSLAGEYFASLTVVAGSAYKVELQLAGFYRWHLAPRIGGSHLALVSGLAAPLAESHGYAVETLDWWRPMPAIEEETGTAPIVGRLIRAREAVEQMATDALAASPRRLRTFRSLLADAQHLAQVREEQVRELTRPWPTMRRAVLRIGVALVERGTLEDTDDVFFLTRQELEAALKCGEWARSVGSRERTPSCSRAQPAPRATIDDRTLPACPATAVRQCAGDARCRPI